jgi:hypothetical protein
MRAPGGCFGGEGAAAAEAACDGAEDALAGGGGAISTLGAGVSATGSEEAVEGAPVHPAIDATPSASAAARARGRAAPNEARANSSRV